MKDRHPSAELLAQEMARVVKQSGVSFRQYEMAAKAVAQKIFPPKDRKENCGNGHLHRIILKEAIVSKVQEKNGEKMTPAQVAMALSIYLAWDVYDAVRDLIKENRLEREQMGAITYVWRKPL